MLLIKYKNRVLTGTSGTKPQKANKTAFSGPTYIASPVPLARCPLPAFLGVTSRSWGALRGAVRRDRKRACTLPAKATKAPESLRSTGKARTPSHQKQQKPLMSSLPELRNSQGYPFGEPTKPTEVSRSLDAHPHG